MTDLMDVVAQIRTKNKEELARSLKAPEREKDLPYLFLECCIESKDMCEFFIKNSPFFPLHQGDSSRKTPLDICIEHNRWEVLEFLLTDQYCQKSLNLFPAQNLVSSLLVKITPLDFYTSAHAGSSPKDLHKILLVVDLLVHLGAPLPTTGEAQKPIKNILRILSYADIRTSIGKSSVDALNKIFKKILSDDNTAKQSLSASLLSYNDGMEEIFSKSSVKVQDWFLDLYGNDQKIPHTLLVKAQKRRMNSEISLDKEGAKPLKI